jgi:hypothetical protein
MVIILSKLAMPVKYVTEDCLNGTSAIGREWVEGEWVEWVEELE